MADTFLDIKNDLIEEMGRSDFTALLPSWVKHVEAKCDRVLEFPINEQVFLQPLPVGTEYVGLPTNHLFARKVVFITPDASSGQDYRRNLVYLTPTDFEAKFPIVLKGSPTHYTISGINFRIGPKVIAIGDLEILYQLRVGKLIADGDTNNIVGENRDIYFNGLAYEANIHFKDFESAAVFKGRFEESMNDANNRHFDRRYSGPISMNFNGGFGGDL